MRGTFANIRLRNQLAPGTEGGWTTLLPADEVMTIYDASVKYREAGVPLIVIAGKEYGSGSSRDWAAKGTLLLGVKAVLAESFERIHRSNLVNMGVLPLEFTDGQNAASLKLTGRETFDDLGMGDRSSPRGHGHRARHGRRRRHREFQALVRIDTPEELVALPQRRHPAVRAAPARGEGVGLRAQGAGVRAQDSRRRAQGMAGCAVRARPSLFRTAGSGQRTADSGQRMLSYVI